MASIATHDLTLSYQRQVIIDSLDLQLPSGQVTVLIGSNGCGKSTLLKSLARLLKPQQGTVVLNGADIHQKSTANVARELAILPQMPSAPEGISVRQLVALGRYPYQNWMQQWSAEDEAMVARALTQTGMQELADRPVDALSGGQRQRAWIAMTLAQDTDIVLLDEPTTFLDLAHQIEVLDLLRDLNRQEGKTIVMVLHDLNLACRYADHMVAVHERSAFAQGRPADILSEALVKQVFGLNCRIIADPFFGTPLCIPFGRDLPQ
ncbi:MULTISPECIES: ABC transporter ATP-binding protein [Pseudomonas]|uniref:ABC transporter ATP-binding protein n=1 Tax=Pseudomonas TaxID=286 RepID=UPI000730ACAA|nr:MULTISPECIES: ABC transporter ATP-binding protein [Pseudomonas]KTB98015.1 iron ABC transporter ATP-binding protein [Pseudomonas sp. ICMP 10191]MBC9741525.1 ABC transporter ATP-binding protein [Pseudomonas syringae pv. syringae]MBC9748271.1 ABC transporter ATP-binding protein [Pseudomonas syringae pv. syringae]MCK9695478.1 ABC transporter ATP-binding protein [Pseudomonas syringae pv. syringae]MCK9720726.1 ABC transporter ATP-binding protein [Pseudomonas syringae pv. syringae]